MRAVSVVVLLTLLLALGCARHHVVSRKAGNVDGKRSITVMSDAEWRISGEPSEDGRER